MDIKYFKDFDTDTVYACAGPMAVNALFLLRHPLASGRQWEFLVPNSPAWDEIHQRIYRNPRVEEVRPGEFPVPLPPLPETPRGPFPQWKDYFLPQQPLHATRYPSVAGFFEAGKREMVTVFVVLYEDTYETALGDGEFHYFRDVFLTREDAQRYMDQNRKEWERLHLRPMAVQLDHAAFVVPDFNPQLFDHYKVEEVLAALEARLRGQEQALRHTCA